MSHHSECGRCFRPLRRDNRSGYCRECSRRHVRLYPTRRLKGGPITWRPASRGGSGRWR